MGVSEEWIGVFCAKGRCAVVPVDMLTPPDLRPVCGTSAPVLHTWAGQAGPSVCSKERRLFPGAKVRAAPLHKGRAQSSAEDGGCHRLRRRRR